MKPLVIPPAAQRDDKAIPAWGIFLADTIRHIANALQEQYGHSAPDTIAAILKSLHDELGDPTSDATGAFSHGHG